MKRKALIIGVAIVLGALGAGYIKETETLLGEEYSLKLASEALDDHSFASPCPRNSYLSQVGVKKNKISFVFAFEPKGGKKCPSLKVVVDRRTGEVWI